MNLFAESNYMLVKLTIRPIIMNSGHPRGLVERHTTEEKDENEHSDKTCKRKEDDTISYRHHLDDRMGSRVRSMAGQCFLVQ
ncbi:hypothetical protein TYRP_014435 [Tyrophagus putrescentiae]|nr:hypothetical protein TYRP_014435 [Tyrophagus putrescentiae]